MLNYLLKNVFNVVRDNFIPYLCKHNVGNIPSKSFLPGFILAQLHLYRENSERKYVDDTIDIQTAQILAYQRLLSYKNSDGSFGFCQNIPSTYLTSSALDVLRRLYHSPYSGQFTFVL